MSPRCYSLALFSRGICIAHEQVLCPLTLWNACVQCGASRASVAAVLVTLPDTATLRFEAIARGERRGHCPTMHGWSAIVEGGESEPEHGGWSEVLASASDDGGGGWAGIIEDVLAEVDSSAGGWDDVLREEVAPGSEDEGGTRQQPSPPTTSAIVPVVAASACGEIALRPSNTQAVVQEALGLVRHRCAGDDFAIGRSISRLQGLPLDAIYRGSRLFEAETLEICKSLASTDQIMTLRAVRGATNTAKHDKAGRIKCLLGSAVCQAEKYFLCEMLDSLTAAVLEADGACISLTFRHRYDETPLRARALCETPLVADSSLVPGSGSAPQVTSVTKVVQHEWVGCALFFVQGRFELVTFSLPVWLSTVERTTADIYHHLCRDVEPVMPRIMDRFQRCQRLAMTDGDAAIAKAERALAKKRTTVPTLHLSCDVHRLSSIGRRSSDIMASDVTGMIQVALSLGSAGAVQSFRRVLRQVLQRRLRIVTGAPGPRADDRRRALLNMFCPLVPGKGASVYRRRLISALANGDWGKSGCFEHYCNGCCRSAEDAEQKILTVLPNLVARQACPSFPRSRWTRAERTLRWLGLLWAMHNLLAEVYIEWARNCGTKSRPHAAQESAFVSGAPPLQDMGATVPDAEALVAADNAGGNAADEVETRRRSASGVPSIYAKSFGFRKDCVPRAAATPPEPGDIRFESTVRQLDRSSGT